MWILSGRSAQPVDKPESKSIIVDWVGINVDFVVCPRPHLSFGSRVVSVMAVANLGVGKESLSSKFLRAVALLGKRNRG